MHLAQPRPATALRLLRARLRGIDGLVWGTTAATVPLGTGLTPPPRPTGVALLAGWRDDSALDAFLATHPLAEALAGGWRARLEPLRADGSWSSLPGLCEAEQPVADDEPVAVVTIGRVRLLRLVPFVRASAPAERAAVAAPGALLVTGITRPPRLVATFSVWRTAAEMRAYAYGAPDRGHPPAIRAHRQRPFHHESIFARFRPRDVQGSWRGVAPLS